MSVTVDVWDFEGNLSAGNVSFYCITTLLNEAHGLCFQICCYISKIVSLWSNLCAVIMNIINDIMCMSVGMLQSDSLLICMAVQVRILC